ncbi:MAG: hypothetical protein LBF55_02905 [Prevotellaceae bacterium]|jgi:hypothetical protein|nr:hypothetical protein [Prevotellaceae bacterium]
MKNKKYLCLLMALSLALCGKAESKEVELLADGVAYSVTYYSGRSGCHVRNKSNRLYRISGDSLAQCLYGLKDAGISAESMAKQLYSKEKIAQLAGKKASIGCIIRGNSAGDVLEVHFALHRVCIDEFGIAKIKALEDLIKAKYKFKYSHICPPEEKYYSFSIGLMFSKYVD